MATSNQTPLIGQIDQDEQQRRQQAPQQDSTGIARLTTGALSLPVAAVRDGLSNIGTDIANIGRVAIGGQPEPRPGYPRTNALAQQTAQGASAFVDANRSLLNNTKSALRDATGTRAALPASMPAIGQNMPTAMGAPAAPAPGAFGPERIQAMARDAASRPATSRQMPAIGNIPDGNGYTQAGQDIAMRRGAGGVPEFTNNAQDVAGARAMPAGGINRVGDGIGGGLSIGQPGDAARAIQSFDRANQIRGEMIRESRRGQIGEGGGRVTIVRDSSRSPSMADLQNDRRDARQAETALRNQQAQQGILSGLDERLTSQLQRVRLGQEIEQGDVAAQDQQRLQGLRAQIADQRLPAGDREAARQSYAALSTPAKDRYVSQDIIMGMDATDKPILGRQVIDVTTGQPISTGQVPTARRTVSSAEVESTAKARGMTKEQVVQMLQAAGVTVGS